MTRRKRRKKVGEVALKEEVEELALSIADRKEAICLLRVEIECASAEIHVMKQEIQGLRVRALDIEDANERSKANALIEALQKRVDDALFKLARYRSQNRRTLEHYNTLEERMAAMRRKLKK
jgi:DNA mismatch repair ATPase MutL